MLLLRVLVRSVLASGIDSPAPECGGEREARSLACCCSLLPPFLDIVAIAAAVGLSFGYGSGVLSESDRMLTMSFFSSVQC